MNVLRIFFCITLVLALTVSTSCSKEQKSSERILSAGSISVYSVAKGGYMPTEKVIKSNEEWKKILAPEKYNILREKGTERAFANKYNDNHSSGIYKCAGCGLDLFSSIDKFDSGTGWPSFTKPVAKENVVEEEDNSLFTKRVEVLCSRCSGHLGHVFNDGPKPTGLRYCMNSAALEFTSSAEMKSTAKETVIFAGGCFWCMEPPFRKQEGVISVTSGYTGGKTENPTYEDVSSGMSGHAEAVRIEFDPSRVSFEKLLEIFWKNIDPTVKNRQFCDIGTQYRTAVFYTNDAQKVAAEKSMKALEESGNLHSAIQTEITAASKFYAAEEYHQDYAGKNPLRYSYYRYGCGRDSRLKELWGEAKKE